MAAHGRDTAGASGVTMMASARRLLATLAIAATVSLAAWCVIRDRRSMEWCQALENGSSEEVARLAAQGVDVNRHIRDRHGMDMTPLAIVARRGDASVALVLLQAGSGLEGPLPEDVPLYWAAGRGNAGFVKLLLDWGADPNAVFVDGGTSAHIASDHGHAEALRVLLEYGADPSIRDLGGRTSLERAHDQLVSARGSVAAGYAPTCDPDGLAACVELLEAVGPPLHDM